MDIIGIEHLRFNICENNFDNYIKLVKDLKSKLEIGKLTENLRCQLN